MIAPGEQSLLLSSSFVSLPELCQTFEVAEARTSGPVNLVFSRLRFPSPSIRLLINSGHNWARCTKRAYTKPEFETVSKHQAAHAQLRSYSIHAESFSSNPKLLKRKKALVAGCNDRSPSFDRFIFYPKNTIFSSRKNRFWPFLCWFVSKSSEKKRLSIIRFLCNHILRSVFFVLKPIV